MYGITETTVHVTYRVIRSVDLERNLGSVIGVPIPDLRLYVLDHNLDPVPIGVPGEICVAGAGVSRGYLNRPELTSERFVRDPFAAQRDSRMYRSGDLARRTNLGELEYLGRIDQQVKIRGFRIEPGEIESVLNLHPEVRESFVMADKAGATAEQLVAYVVPANARFNAGELKAHLSQQLPEYMVPALIIPVSALPLTMNGKIDRSALPKFAVAPAETESVAAPTTETEKLLQTIWSELLSQPRLGIDDNFFQLGGHSLLATQVMSRIEHALGTDLPFAAIFEFPTIRGLAKQIETEMKPTKGHSAPIQRRLAAQRAEELLSRIDQLSDEEVERLLGDSQNAFSP